MELRSLTEDGIQEFRKYFWETDDALPRETILTNDKYSQPTEYQIDIPESIGEKFENRMELGQYFGSLFEGLEDSVLRYQFEGTWAWMALYWIDELKGGRKSIHNFVPTADYNNWYRHTLRGAWGAVADHGPNARIILSAEINKTSDFFEQLAARKEFYPEKHIIALANRMYFDESTNRPRVNSDGRNPIYYAGSLRNYIDFLWQISVNYDLHSMDEQSLIELLPEQLQTHI